MENTHSPKGLLTDLVTPMQGDGSLDSRGLGRLLDRVAGNCQAVLLASPRAGEGGFLDPDARARLLEDALLVLRGRKPVLIWFTNEDEDRTRQTLAILNRLRKRHAAEHAVFFVDAPLYYHSNRGLASLYQEYRDLTGDGVFLLYNDPVLVGSTAKRLKRSNIRTAILKELSSLPHLAGLIFHGSLDRAGDYQKAVRAHPDFRIYDGDEEHFLDFPSMSGVVSCGANLLSSGWQTIMQSSLHLEGSSKNYPDFLRQIWDLGNFLRLVKKRYDASPAAVIKAVLAKEGVIESPFSHVPCPSAEALAGEIAAMMKDRPL